MAYSLISEHLRMNWHIARCSDSRSPTAATLLNVAILTISAHDCTPFVMDNIKCTLKFFYLNCLQSLITSQSVLNFTQ